ncbi:MAG: hypothetical protein KGJ60_08430 [Verrucomicrobiota bacterium]|nr:hypothetical protein [Verrucomicrobiota bacterium]
MLLINQPGFGSISQTGVVPGDAQSLLFQLVLNGMSVSLDGQDVLLVALSSGIYPNGIDYTEYGADISAFAGRAEKLTFLGGGTIDDIQFSSQPISEPFALSLIFLAGGVLASLRVHRRSNSG